MVFKVHFVVHHYTILALNAYVTSYMLVCVLAVRPCSVRQMA